MQLKTNHVVLALSKPFLKIRRNVKARFNLYKIENLNMKNKFLDSINLAEKTRVICKPGGKMHCNVLVNEIVAITHLPERLKTLDLKDKRAFLATELLRYSKNPDYVELAQSALTKPGKNYDLLSDAFAKEKLC